MKIMNQKPGQIALELLTFDTMHKMGVKIIDAFELEGVVFKGNYSCVVNEFVKNNPTGGDFYVWVSDNYEILKS